jgi:hypothetical protein
MAAMGARDTAHHRDVVILEVDDEAVEAVRDRRANRTARVVLRPEHEVVHQQLRAPSKQVCERGAAFIRVEAVVLVDPDPGKLLAPPGKLVVASGQLLLGVEKLEPGRKPLLARSGHVVRHCLPLLPAR